jgi:flotillin
MIKVSALNATAVDGQNQASIQIAESNSLKNIKESEAYSRAGVAKADAEEEVAKAEKKAEKARLLKEEVVREEIEKEKVEIKAEAEADYSRILAKGEADATWVRYEAEAKGIRAVLDAKAEGYRQLVEASGGKPECANAYLMLDKLPEIIKTQVEALRNIQIDKVTIWDSGRGGENGQGPITGLTKDMIGCLPIVQELAKQSGIELPKMFGTPVESSADVDADSPKQTIID